MNCPDCENFALEKVLSRQGLEVDYCRQCGGVWLDRGEIYFLARRTQTWSRRLKEGDNKNKEKKYSPKTSKPMTVLNYPEGSEIYICDSGGIWIDGRQIRKYNQGNEGSLNLSIVCGGDKKLQSGTEDASSSTIKAKHNRGSASFSWTTVSKNLTIMVILSTGALVACMLLKSWW